MHCIVISGRIVDIIDVISGPIMGEIKDYYDGATVGQPYRTKEDDIDAILVDHELRLSMVELGLDPNNESEVTT